MQSWAVTHSVALSWPAEKQVGGVGSQHVVMHATGTLILIPVSSKGLGDPFQQARPSQQ